MLLQLFLLDAALWDIKFVVVSLAGLASAMGESQPQLDTAGLAKEWEQEVAIRDHLRQEGNELFDKDASTESIKTCVCDDAAHAALRIVLLRMASSEGSPQPPVTPLRDEIEKLYKRCGAATDEKTVYGDSWMIRRLCCFIKMKARKKQVSTAPCFCNQFGFFRLVRSAVPTTICYMSFEVQNIYCSSRKPL